MAAADGAPLNLEEAINAVGKDNIKKNNELPADERGIQDLKSRGSSGDI